MGQRWGTDGLSGGAGAGAVAVGVAVLAGFLSFTLLGSKRKPKPFLDKTKQKIPLTQKIRMSHDTFLFRFALPSRNHCLGVPPGKHIKIFGKCPPPKIEGHWNGRKDDEVTAREIERKYTPTSSDDDFGFVDLVVKIYRPGDTYTPPKEKFTDGGKLSRYLDSLKIGDMLEIQGPFGHIEYKGNGQFQVMGKQVQRVKRVGMVASGTGITPMLQIIKAIMKDKADETRVSLLYANLIEDNILVREMLNKQHAENCHKFHLHYTLASPPAGWTGLQGNSDEEKLRRLMPGPEEDSIILMCGAPSMMDKVLNPTLKPAPQICTVSCKPLIRQLST